MKEHSIPEGERNLFVGKSLLALGEASCPRLEDEVRMRGGSVVTTKEDADFIIVRLVRYAKIIIANYSMFLTEKYIISGSKLCWEEQDERIRAKFRTECWLEQCIHKERICESDEHISFYPLRETEPVAGEMF